MADEVIVGYFIIDATCLNTFVLWNMNNPTWKDRKGSRRLDKRRLFLTEAAHGIIMPMIAARAENKSISHQPLIVRALLVRSVRGIYGWCQTYPIHISTPSG